MARYLIQAAYTADAAAAFARQPQERETGLRALLERVGARLESFDYSLGDYDVVAIMTAPDNATATAVSLAVQAAGHMTAYKTTPLLSQAEFLEASRQASGAGYRAPSAG